MAWSLSVSGPVLPLYVRSLGVEIMDWGFLATAHSMGLILFDGFWGTVSDRVDRGRMVVAALICMGIVFPFYTFKSLVPLFFILQFAVGASVIAVGPITRALIADSAPEESLGFYMSLWFTFSALGGMMGPLLGGYISEVFGFKYAFYTSSILPLSSAAVLAVSLRNRLFVEKPNTERGWSISISLRKLLSVPAVRMIFLLAVAVFTGMSTIIFFLPIYASERVGMSTVAIGLLQTLASGTQLAVTPFLGRLSDKLSRRNMVGFGLATSAVLFPCYIVAATPIQMTLLTVGIAGCLSTASLILTMLSMVVSQELSGMAMGIYGSFEDLGLILGPLIYGLIWEIYSPSHIFLESAVSLLIGLVFIAKVKEK